MAARRQQRPPRPVPAALQRILALAGRSVSPARMAREVEVIIAEWRRGVEAEEGTSLAEQIEELRAQLADGAAAAEEALGDVDASDTGAARQARLMLDCLTATRDAAEGALAPA